MYDCLQEFYKNFLKIIFVDKHWPKLRRSPFRIIIKISG